MSGYQIPFHSAPVQLHVPVTKCSDLTVPLVDAEVNKLLSIGAIKAIPFSKENFYSKLFLVPKKEGTYRPVIDLSRLNKFVENFHFQMENISCLKTLLRRGDFMTCIDLKDAYLSVHVHKSSLKYLCFQWRNKCYAFQGLPFGLNTAPRVFTKLLKPVAAYLRKRGIRIIVYLDDFLILGSSIEESKANTQLTLDLLQWLGFTINWDKSFLVPTQSLTFLGLSIDSQTMSLSLPEKKILNIQNKCQRLIRNPTASARTVASLIGTLEAARPAIWQAPLHYRQLQIQVIKSLQASQDNYETLMSLNSKAHTELQWWLHNIATVNGSTINPPAPELYITSDASKAGWGACCQNLTANGRWSPLEAKDHINVLELKAAFLVTKAFLKDQSNITVCLRMDNTTAVAHINNKGGTRSPQLVNLTLELWQWCLQKSILITAQHLPGKLNNVADRESREFYDSSEWQIDPQVIQPFLRSCSVDLFASRLTALLPTYASWKPDPGATYTDAMTLDWSLLKGYAFPPFSLIAPVLKKVSQDKADLVLVAPVWQAKPWWPALLNLLIKNPVMIPNSKHLLRDPAFPLRIHPMYPRLHLAVFQLSGNSTKQKVFQRTLPEYCNKQLVPPHIRHTSQPGDNGIAGVLNGKLIRFQPPSMMSFSS